MAIFFENTSMVFWRIKMNGTDVTSILNKFVKSITVKDGAVAAKTKDGNALSSPSTAIITISSFSYIEDVFVEGTELSIYLGYDRLSSSLVFRGKIMSLPDGSATEMMHYTIKAFGSGLDLAMREKNRTFNDTIKSHIVSQIAVENGYAADVRISDLQPIKAQFAPIQKQETDFAFLNRCAHDWKCLMWFQIEKTFDVLRFMDSSQAHLFGDINSVDVGQIYNLGYRTSYTECNVAKVEWKHRPPRAGSLLNPGFLGLNENGSVDNPNQYRILALGQTWKIKPQYLKEAKNSGYKFGLYAILSVGATLSLDAYTALGQYYEIEKSNDSTSKDIDPPHDESGFELTVTLNIGDPDLKPPRNAYLWHGGSQYTSDEQALLPNWLFRNTPYPGGPAQLKINSTELKYTGGRLVSVLKCSMGDVGA